jgi:MerR family redox-sensitive transcriptional activator SoxR
MSATLSIGDIAARTGLAVSAIRYYEDEGLIRPFRNAGNQRRFDRADIRRLSFVKIAQELGFPLAQIRALLRDLPDGRTPTKADWAKISLQFRADLNDRIRQLERLRDRLDGCIGCGCLSLQACKLYNPQDRAAERGSGPRWILGERDA